MLALFFPVLNADPVVCLGSVVCWKVQVQSVPWDLAALLLLYFTLFHYTLEIDYLRCSEVDWRSSILKLLNLVDNDSNKFRVSLNSSESQINNHISEFTLAIRVIGRTCKEFECGGRRKNLCLDSNWKSKMYPNLEIPDSSNLGQWNFSFLDLVVIWILFVDVFVWGINTKYVLFQTCDSNSSFLRFSFSVDFVDYKIRSHSIIQTVIGEKDISVSVFLEQIGHSSNVFVFSRIGIIFQIICIEFSCAIPGFLSMEDI